jgi:hypothetical protein
MDKGQQWHPSLLHPNYDTAWTKHTAWVKPHALLSHQGNELRNMDTIHEITNDLKQGKGLREPLWLEWSPDSYRAKLGEGNHRLHAAIAAGTSHVPVVGYKTYSIGNKFPMLPPKDSLNDYVKSIGGPGAVENGYFPQYFNPKHILPSSALSDIGIGQEWS